MNVLITGGAGFIGRSLTLRLKSLGYGVKILDNLSHQIHGGSREWPDELSCLDKSDLVLGTITDKVLLDSLLGDVDSVVHLAAETGTGQSMYEIHHYTTTNVDASSAMLELMTQKHRHIKKFVFASSRSVYGEGSYKDSRGVILTPKSRTKNNLEKKVWGHFDAFGNEVFQTATKENSEICPASIYAASKYSIEITGKILADCYNFDFEALRFQNVYGEGQSLLNPYTGILSIFANLMRANKPVNIFEDGNESRDFVHVSDVVNAIILSLNIQNTGNVALNIGSGVPTSVCSIAEKLKSILRSDSNIIVTGDYRLGDIRHCFADLSLAKNLLGFEPKIDIDVGLKRFCDWVVTQPVVDIQAKSAQDKMMSLGLGKSSVIN
jgi:dTDP-L-rhamnose 4-epimerase